MTTQITDHEVFWLARYAHNVLAPVIKEAQAIEPTIRLEVQMSFANPDAEFADGYVSVFSHWDRADMFIYCTRNRTKADIDTLAADVRARIADLGVAA